MRTLFSIGLSLFVFLSAIATIDAQEPRELLEQSRRIVFLGDSITAAGPYVADVDAWLVSQRLNPTPKVIDAGLPSETVSGLSEEGHAGGQFPRPDLEERLERVLKATKPDLVIACYGINCGIYEPFDEGRFKRYQQGMQNLNAQVEKAGAKLVIVTPPFYDDQQAPKPFSYQEVLVRYAGWLIDQRDQGWMVVDLNGPMAKEVARRRMTEPSFTFQPDGVHPNADGHWFVARQVIRWFGDDTASSSATPREMLKAKKIPEGVMPLVEERVSVLRDAYVSAAGHKRPGVAAGLPIGEAEAKAQELSQRIGELLASAGRESSTAERAGERNWPRWRGPHDDGSSREGAYAEGWQDPKQILWKVKLPGIGCSTPAVWDDHILLTCPIEGQNAALAFDWQGNLLWRTTLGEESAGKHRNGSGCNPSLVTDGQHVFAYFKSGELAGLDFGGSVLWKTNLQERFAKDTLYWDIGTSPVLTEKAVVVAVMHTGGSYLAAFDKQTGELQWKVARDYKTPVEGDQSYATPILVEQGGEPVIVVWGAEHLTGHAPDDGRILWSCGGFNPERNPNWVAVASAVVAGDLAIVPYGRGSRVTAVRLGGSGDVTETHRAWTRQDTGSFVPTPAVQGDNLIVVRDEGEVECLDLRTGETVWKDRFPKHRTKYYASPLIAGGKLYAPREDGMVFVADVRDKFQLLSSNDMGERVIASPVAVAGRLLIRGEEHLVCIGE